MSELFFDIDKSNIKLELQSVLWKLLSCFCFAGINGIVRYLTKFQGVSACATYFYQYLFACVLLLIVWGPKISVKEFKTKYPLLHAIRIIFSATGTVFLYTSFRHIPIAQTLSFALVGPILTIIGAVFLLKEQLTLNKVIAILVSTVGCYLIVKTDNKDLEGLTVDWILILPLIATSFFVVAKLVTSKLARAGESLKILTCYLLFFSCPVSFIFFLNDWQYISFTLLPWILFLSALTIIAFYAYNKSYSLADVTFLMPFGAARLIISIFIGYIAFGEYPQTISTWLGIGLIVISVVLLGCKKR